MQQICPAKALLENYPLVPICKAIPGEKQNKKKKNWYIDKVQLRDLNLSWCDQSNLISCHHTCLVLPSTFFRILQNEVWEFTEIIYCESSLACVQTSPLPQKKNKGGGTSVHRLEQPRCLLKFDHLMWRKDRTSVKCPVCN